MKGRRKVEEKNTGYTFIMPPKEEYYKEIEELWGSHWLTNMGVKHNKLEDELKQYLEVEIFHYLQMDIWRWNYVSRQ